MTQYVSDQYTKAPQASSSESGNAWADDSKVTVGANLTTSDEVVLMRVPAGVRLTDLEYRAGDLDTGTPSLTINLGYRSLHPDKNVADAFTAFLSASTAFQSAQASWVPLVFAPLEFQEPVAIVMRPQASGNALGTPADIYTRARGTIRGVK